MNSTTVQSTDDPKQDIREKLFSNAIDAATSLVGDNKIPPRFFSVNNGGLYQTAKTIIDNPAKLNSMITSGKIPMGEVRELCDTTSLADRILQFSRNTGFIHDCLNLITPLRGAIETLQEWGSGPMVMELIHDGTPYAKSYQQYLDKSNSLHISFEQITQKTGFTVNLSGLPAQIKSEGERHFNELLDLLVKNVHHLKQMPEMSAPEISKKPSWDGLIQESIHITDKITQLVTGNTTVRKESIDLAEYTLPRRGY